MKDKPGYSGTSIPDFSHKKVRGHFIDIMGERFYKIHNYDQMQNFFISLNSCADHWMFISSNGALTAGRKNRDNALFPYYTEDKIHDYRGISGSISHFIVEHKGKKDLWEPFSKYTEYIYSFERNIYKNFYGNKLIFEEINHDLNLTYHYTWLNSEKFGFIKRSLLKNSGSETKKISILDGLGNILPAGTDYNFQNEYSNLLDAYKKNELIKESNTGLFTLSSIPVDRAEPSESLYANTVFSLGFENPGILLCTDQTDKFKAGEKITTETDIRARRGAYLLNAEIRLNPGQEKKWMFVSEINQDGPAVSGLNKLIQNNDNLLSEILTDVDAGTEKLKKIASAADGMQLTDSDLSFARHYSNTIYNVMRGGTFADNYTVNVEDYKKYLSEINTSIDNKFQSWKNELPESISYQDLVSLAENTGDTDLARITYEYLPLTFSRRHGDPSRPWNVFSVETKNSDGSLKFNYEGNWRDIFQNWEALSYSFPGFIEGMICRFLNASTFDGYNPYRIMKKGIDWESPDPADPWAYIGYWGDHQIIYLQKLLELSNNFHPGKLESLLTREIFTFANVPYRIKPYKEIIDDPKDTIVFDSELNTRISEKQKSLGEDAKLLTHLHSDKIVKVNMPEKIFITMLTKLSNFIPDAGIWLNTQRPEWNDANNALVGNGASMVTLYYLRRFLSFWRMILKDLSSHEFNFSEEVATLFEDIYDVFKENIDLPAKGFSDSSRKNFTDSLGYAHEKYRNRIYDHSFSGKRRNIKITDLYEFINLSLNYIDHSINANKRKDGLYHSYNLITITGDKIKIRYLYEMLEGQVAVLSSGYLDPALSLEILESLKASKIYREDQYSYMLYPDRILPRFTEKNIIPADKVRESKLLSMMLVKNDTGIIKSDPDGKYYFNSDFRNADFLEDALDKLSHPGYEPLIKEEKKKILDIYEDVFDHKSFTGRSGTFYGYEGLGCIYWHMVSKLLLAVQECYFKAIDEKASKEPIGKLKEHYYEIKAGIGVNKSPDLYGAFPTDAYSHTPGTAGVKQPGLTGQVKEDVISRLNELGIRIRKGEICFNTSLVNEKELLSESKNFEYYDTDGIAGKIPLGKNQLAMTICQVPVIYEDAKDEYLLITLKNSEQTRVPGSVLPGDLSDILFKRTGKILKIEVYKNILKSN